MSGFFLVVLVSYELRVCVCVLTAEQVQDLVREWIDLVTERDKLLREELQQVSVFIRITIHYKYIYNYMYFLLKAKQKFPQ